ncbi:MAG: hypothetical protein ACSLFL_09670 [Alphaproteobacteria bacterium]
MTRIAHSNERNVRYFCQWESPELVEQFISRKLTPMEDPKWRLSGAQTPEEYDLWSWHLCGMACLKMILALDGGPVYPIINLARLATDYGAYVETSEGIKGLIYAPFAELIESEFGHRGKIYTGITASDLPNLMGEYDLFMASVHHTIRRPGCIPPGKGGHLVLITRIKDDDTIVFHNPSGDQPQNQIDATLSTEAFEKFFAGRGIAIALKSKLGGGRKDGLDIKSDT